MKNIVASVALLLLAGSVAMANPIGVGTAIGVDIGTGSGSGANYNVFAAAGSIGVGSVTDTSGVVVDGVSLTFDGPGFNFGSGITAPSFPDEVRGDFAWSSTAYEGSKLVLTISGLDPDYLYDWVSASSFNNTAVKTNRVTLSGLVGGDQFQDVVRNATSEHTFTGIQPTAAGVITATVTETVTSNPILNGVRLTATAYAPLPSAPVMVVKGNGNTIASGDPASVANDTDFGPQALNDSVTHTFTIENTGDAELVLSGSPKVAVSGGDAALFVVTSLPTLPETPVASGGGTTTFDVEFTATGAEGAKTANLIIENNAGPDYTIPLAGAVNSTPTDIALAPSTVAENSAVGTEIGTLTTTDADGADTFTYTLVTGNGTDDADNGLVAIAGGKVNVAGLIDYETNPTLEIRVQTEDPAGATFEKALTIAVTDETETFMMVAVGDVAVDDDVVGTVLAEGDSTSVSYAVTGGFHQSLFDIPDPASGELKLATPAAAGDLGNTYYVEVTATGSSPSASATMRIKVTVVSAGTSTGTIFLFR